MLNKRRQELIIQNLKSISSQVRLMAVEQLKNLPAMPPQEKIKYLEICLQDSEGSVVSAAKKAISELGGKQGSSVVESSISGLEQKTDKTEQSTQKGIPNFGLPDLSAFSSKSNNNTNIDKPAVLQSDNINKDLATHKPDIETDSKSTINPVNSNPVPTPHKANTVSKSDFIDGPVDPSLPEITSSSDIGFLIQHIADITKKKPAGYLTRLYELSKSVHEEVALTALQNLLNLKDNRIPPHILVLLNDSNYSSQRRFLMLKIIMNTEVSLSADLLENILVNEKDVIIKSGLVKVFARNCNQDGIPLLIQCLKDDDPRVRANTIEVIEAQHIVGCETEIIKLLGDSENRVKVNAAKFLVKIGYRQAFLTLQNMFNSPEVWLRDSVVFALGEIADRASLKILKDTFISDPNQGIRLSVLKALAKINNNLSRQILAAAVRDPDPVVSQVALSLCEKLKNQPIREEVILPSSMTIPEKPKIIQKPSFDLSQNVPIPNTTSTTSATANITNNVTSNLENNNLNLTLQNNKDIDNTPKSEVVLPDLSLFSNDKSQLLQQKPQSSQTVNPQSFNSQPINTQTVNPQQINKLPNNIQTPSNISVPKTVTTNVQQPKQANILPKPSAPILPRKLPPINSLSNLNKTPTSQNQSTALSEGSPSFEKPRSASIYAKLCSSSVDEQKSGMKDIAFVMGQDQMILLEKAISLPDESIRIEATKVLSRKRTPEAKAMLKKLTSDPNETVASLAKKTFQLIR